MAGRPKGTLKTGGRQSGTPNKVTSEFKELIGNFLEADYEKFLTEMKKLTGRDYVTFYMKLIEYKLPKKREQAEVIDFSNLTEEQAAKVIDKLAEQLKNEHDQ